MSEIISPNEVLSQETQTETEILPFPESPPAEFVINPGKFKVLNIHKVRNEKRFEGKDMRDVAWEYIRCTNNIIKVLDGREEHRDLEDDDKDKNTVPFARPDVVVYLDKSARPVSWLVNKFWQVFADKKAVKPMKKSININVGDDFIKDIEDVYEADPATKFYRFNRLSQNQILAIRAVFHRGELTESNWKSEVIDDKKSNLANKNILIVDEVKCQGRQMMVAQGILKSAFPKSRVTGVYFWDSRPKQVLVGNQYEWQMTSIPAWYDKETDFGRGVGDKSDFFYNFVYEKYHNIRSKLGSFIISAPHFEKEKQKDGRETVKGLVKDELANDLLKDINQLHQDYIKSGLDKLLT